ncbi:hypothetical protein VP01_4106g2 [Puccinia sorghi]|uniref:Uncharacterized protein n=1 Tax=Puccinia sorghi TaxID=27349 RepID=A0A0L6US38_9BASI|nr:hypothetical protein VP01_4106g2 [Puccinia sorghi]
MPPQDVPYLSAGLVCRNTGTFEPTAMPSSLFRMTLVDFRWLASILHEELEQDLLRRGDPLTVVERKPVSVG